MAELGPQVSSKLHTQKERFLNSCNGVVCYDWLVSFGEVPPLCVSCGAARFPPCVCRPRRSDEGHGLAVIAHRRQPRVFVCTYSLPFRRL